MTHPLGRGLESLIPKKASPPPDAPSLDVLAAQQSMGEPVYHFHEEESTAEAALVDVDAPPAELTVAAATGEVPSRARRAESVFWIDVAKIEPNPQQPRGGFDAGELLALATSLREHGVLQPLLVTKRELETSTGLDVRYQLLTGERRWRAAKLAGLREVPVIIRTAETSEREKLEIALIENVQREDLNPMERAHAFQKLIEEFGLMQKEVAERVGKSREVVANTLRLLRLPPEVQAALAGNAITEGHARALLMLEGKPEEQSRLLTEVRGADLSVRNTELAARALGGAAVERRSRRRASRLDPDARDIQRRLEEAFGTRVSLVKRGEQGKIIVEFYSAEELEGILQRLGGGGAGYV